jgi:hypothetical protein
VTRHDGDADRDCSMRTNGSGKGTAELTKVRGERGTRVPCTEKDFSDVESNFKSKSRPGSGSRICIPRMVAESLLLGGGGVEGRFPLGLRGLGGAESSRPFSSNEKSSIFMSSGAGRVWRMRLADDRDESIDWVCASRFPRIVAKELS